MRKGKMASAICLVICLCVFIPSLVMAEGSVVPLGTPGADPEQAANMDILFMKNCDTNTILFQKQQDVSFIPVGGSVAWMTALIAAAELNPDTIVEVNDNFSDLPEGSRKIGLRSGDMITVRDLLAAMLLYGAQDAAIVLAKQCAAGSLETFVTKMNDQASQLGMSSTHYSNPFGAYDTEQTTTATDFVLLAEKVTENEELQNILSQDKYTVESDVAVLGDQIQNRCKLMQANNDKYDVRVTGSALGSTTRSGTVAAFFVKEQDSKVIIILTTKKDIDETNTMMGSLMDYCSNFEKTDLSPYVQELADSIQIQTKTAAVSDCGIADDDQLVFTAYPGFSQQFDQTQLKIKIDESSIAENAVQNEPVALASLYYQDNKLTDLHLIADAIEVSAQPTQPIPESTETTGLVQYTPSPSQVQSRGFLAGNRWFLWIVAAGAFAVVTIIIGKVLRNRMQ